MALGATQKYFLKDNKLSLRSLEDYGQVELGPDRKVAIISYYGPNIYQYREQTYNAIALYPSLGENMSRFVWNIKEWNSELATYTTDKDIQDSESPSCNYIPSSTGFLVISVTIYDEGNNQLYGPIRMAQYTYPPLQYVEELIERSALRLEGSTIPFEKSWAGDPVATREYLYDLLFSVQELIIRNQKDTHIDAVFFKVFLYQHLITYPKKYGEGNSFNREKLLKDWQAEIDGQSSKDIVRTYFQFGLIHLPPPYIVMFLSAINTKLVNNEGNGISWEELPLPTSTDNKYQKQTDLLYDQFDGLNQKQKAKVFNLIRYPKACLKMTYFLLNHLKNRVGRFKDLKTKDFKSNDLARRIVVSEFEKGPIGIDYSTEESNSEEGMLKPTSFAKKLVRLTGHPLFKFEIEQGDFEIAGKVLKKGTEETPEGIGGVEVQLYYNKIEVLAKSLPLKNSYQDFSNAATLLKLKKGDTGLVLDAVWSNSNAGGDFVKIIVTGFIGWIRIATDSTTIKAKIYPVRVPIPSNQSLTDNDGAFKLSCQYKIPHKLRFVKPLGTFEENPSGNGYFDAESDWFEPPLMSLSVQMEPASFMIEETELTSLLTNFEEYTYGGPNYPDSFYMNAPGFTISQPDGEKIDCNSLTEALIFEAWRGRYGNSVQISSSEHKIYMNYQKVWNWSKQTDQEWKISGNPFGSIEICINKNFAVNEIVYDTLCPGSNQRLQWLLVQGWSAWNNDQENIKPYDSAGQELPANAPNINHHKISGQNNLGGHNFFIVDVHPYTKRVLELESNLNSSSLKTNGASIRWLGNLSNPDAQFAMFNGSQREIIRDDIISPNLRNSEEEGEKDILWVQKIRGKCSQIEDHYDASVTTTESETNGKSICYARLKICNLKWSNANIYSRPQNQET